LNRIKWEDIRIEDIGLKSIIKLLDVLNSNSSDVDKNIAYKSLIKLEKELVEPYLEKYLIENYDYDDNQSEVLLRLLKKLNKNNNLLFLFQLKDPDFVRRAVAVEKIGELKLQSYLAEVIKLIDDDDPSVRFAVCKTLKMFLKDGIINLNHILKNDILLRLMERNSRENNRVIKKTIQRLISNYFNI